MHDGVIPNTQISRLLGLEHRWNAAQAAFAPVVSEDGESALPGLWIAGDAAGIGGAELAGITGSLAGHAVASRPGCRSRRHPPRDGRAFMAPCAGRKRAVRPLGRCALSRPAAARTGNADEAVLCRCEAVTVAAIRRAMELGANGPNRVKTFTRCGMGPCQGRICANPLTRLVAQETGATADANRRPAHPRARSSLCCCATISNSRRPRMRVDLVVIGGGLIGLACAFEARRAGLGVLLLERDTCGRHASSASAGGVRSLNRDPAEIPLARAALPLWAGLAERLGADVGFAASGQIRVAEDEAALAALEARATRTRSAGWTHERMIGLNVLFERGAHACTPLPRRPHGR